MKRQLPLAGFGLFALSTVLLVLPAFAHHGFQYEYDGNKYVTVTGVLTKIEWENPHIYFNVDVTDVDGKVTSWRFEGSSVTLVKRTGVSRSDFADNIGKTISVNGCPALGGLPRVAAETVKLPDGRQIVVARKRYLGDGSKTTDDKDNN
jgi:hypothetical protein